MAARSRRERSSSRVRGLPLLLLGLAAIVAAVAGVSVWLFAGGSSSEKDDGPPTAAIVDQLSLTYPGGDFLDRATATLESAGYAVDYYPGEVTDVDFYRKLPVLGYDLIIFRNHADRLLATTPEGEKFDEVILFTSEPFQRERFLDEQAKNRLVISRYYEGGDPYYGISSRFVKDSMIGDFHGATIIMMGCEGLLNDSTAKAFIDRGASSYISWNESVTATHTDAAGERLLELLIDDGLSPRDAAAETMKELGPDPAYGSTLLAYPGG